MPPVQSMRTTRGIQQSLLPPPAQLVIPSEGRGVVYTKRWVVEMVLDLAGYQPERNLVDALAIEPAAGDGAFLQVMIERLVDSCVALGRPITACIDSLIAYELDHSSAERARQLASDLLLARGIDHSLARQLASSWIKTGDFLLDSVATKADFVVGNPPYVRIEDIPEETASVYRSLYRTMRGRADLYVAFFEAALHQLKPGGTCAFICADRWMRNQYGSDLREMVTSGYSVDVIVEMHNADAFDDDVAAYPAITVIRRATQSATVVASAGAGIETISSAELTFALLATSRGEIVETNGRLRAARVESWFSGADPWPCQNPAQLALLRDLESRFPKLEHHAKVGIGVATGNDRVFITKDPMLVEPSRLLKLGLAGDLGGGTMNWSGHYLVNPWDENGLVKLEEFPKLLAYFHEHAAVLKKRHTATKNAQGWFRTIDRVTHSLTRKPKLYIADIKNTLDPVLDPGETYPHHNLYFIESSEWDLEVLGGLLMSAVGQFFVESYGVRMRGGYMRFQAQYLRRIRVAPQTSLSDAQKSRLVRAFRDRDREAATTVALGVYGIDRGTWEVALGHR